MNVLLMNDTSEDNNPGCKITVSGLNSLFNLDDNVYRLSKGFGYKYFRNCYKSIFNKQGPFITRINKVIFMFRSKKNNQQLNHKEPSINKKLWDKAIRKIELKETEFIKLLDSMDKVVFNMEGTIHHNAIGALTLLGLAYLAKKKGKHVSMVNGTIQAMDTNLLKIVLNEVDYIAVREPKSKQYLNSLKIKCTQSSDCAFLPVINVPHKNMKYMAFEETNSCLFTPGVLVTNSNNKSFLNEIEKQINTIRKKGYNPVYFRVEKSEGNELFLLMNKLSVPIVYASEIPWSGIGEFLKQFKVVISGRYHILIFSIMSRVPIVPLISNSWKINGLIELIDGKMSVINNSGELDVALNGIESKNHNYNLDELFLLAKRNIHNVM